MSTLALSALVGCGARGRPPKPSAAVAGSAAKAKENAPRKVVQTGSVMLESANDDGTTAWKVHGESARAGLQEGAPSEFFLSNVTGDVYDGKKVVSTLAAEEAKAETASKKLVLSGQVSVTSTEQDIVLHADKVRWMEDRRLFAASGNVQIESPDFALGKMDEVWATPDLRRIGNPSKFK
ncbi:MAG: LPS export ABC transporter periplasmic protein LptC [Armatimonadetes bacterium]|nr:LPS export ABC transporter periplasmic protein LptC [Armatimonadota bacterium]MBS1710589.1 LPS export ABC transporter periplasmic protein LptC [Armatimonadota bacterium]MBX3108260.1 LPS export ABC transporter periplasmic protein LptC [Fimbriimonadaceae bacterium]